MQTGTLYIVATPIGNLEDITLRALRVLGEVNLVLCEDTRHTKTLLVRHNIKTKTESYHAHSSEAKMAAIARRLENGEDLALVSDAGTPLVSDPGSALIAYLKSALGRDLRLVPIPGASALTAALSVVPVPSGHFTFRGFLPQKKGRQTAIRAMRDAEEAQVVYESSHRILKLMGELAVEYPDAVVTICRELTKQFEEILEGSPEELLATLAAHPEKQKGEFVVILTKGYTTNI